MKIIFLKCTTVWRIQNPENGLSNASEKNQTAVLLFPWPSPKCSSFYSYVYLSNFSNLEADYCHVTRTSGWLKSDNW